MTPITRLVVRAQAGDLEAYEALVRATQAMVYGAARGVLRDPTLAQDAVQLAYLRAFRRLGDLREPATFAGWLRRVTITVALNMRRARRRTLLCLDEIADVPMLDETETRWTDAQRGRLAAALLTLGPEERQACDRRYHGGWSVARLAATAGVDEAAMRKRLQRIRDRLRKEIEMAEQRDVQPGEMQPDLPAKVVELLARPQLTDLPENPVGKVLELLRSAFPELVERAVPEVVDLTAAERSVVTDAIYVAPTSCTASTTGASCGTTSRCRCSSPCATTDSPYGSGPAARPIACARPTLRTSRRSTRPRRCGSTNGPASTRGR